MAASRYNTQLRYYSTKSDKVLTHVDERGKVSMVNVTGKSATVRKATAMARVKVGYEIAKLIKENSMKKGDVLSVAQIAGIIGAKKTSDIIPLCHNIPLTSIKVNVQLDNVSKEVMIQSSIECEGRTGVEMEALTAVTVAALTVYDMCKAVSKNIQISDIHLISKSGGSSGNYTRPEINVREYEKEPIVQPSVFVGGV